MSDREIAAWNRLLADKNAEIERLRRELADARAQLATFTTISEGYR